MDSRVGLGGGKEVTGIQACLWGWDTVGILGTAGQLESSSGCGESCSYSHEAVGVLVGTRCAKSLSTPSPSQVDSGLGRPKAEEAARLS